MNTLVKTKLCLRTGNFLETSLKIVHSTYNTNRNYQAKSKKRTFVLDCFIYV